MNINILTKLHLEFINVTGGCTGLSKFIHVILPHCWKTLVAAQVKKHMFSFKDEMNACEDKTDCAGYGALVCELEEFSHHNCRKYCGLCDGKYILNLGMML